MKNILEIMEQVVKESLLKEEFPYTSPGEMYGLDAEPATNSVPAQLFKTVADQQPDRDEVTELDFQYLIANPQEVDEKTQSKLIALINTESAPEDVKVSAQAVIDSLEAELEKKAVQRQTITQPQIRTAAGEIGDFPDEMNTIINTVFGDTTNFLDRIRETSEISNFYYKAAQDPETYADSIAAKPNTEFLAEVMLLEYFAEIANSFDTGAGAYLFEYYLAALAGGRVTGREAGPTTGMGAVDFRTADGSAGSSKFYSRKTNIQQAVSGFEIGEEVQYIIALKKQTVGQIGKTQARGGSDPSRIMAADIYYFSVTRTGENDFQVSGVGSNKNLFKKVAHITKDGKLRLGSFMSESTRIGTIFIAETRTKTFRDMVFKSVSSSIGSIKDQILTELQSFFQQLEVAESSCKKFAATGEIDEGSNTLTALDAADQSFENFAQKLVGGTIDRETGLEITENKNNFIKTLDKLCYDVILDIMNK